MTQNRSCCRSAKSAHSGVTSFCDMINPHSLLRVAKLPLGARLEIRLPQGEWTDFVVAMRAYACTGQTPSIQLARVVVAAWADVRSLPDGIARLEQKLSTVSSGVGMLVMKHELFQLASLCSLCSGRGCPSCSGMGLAVK